MSDCLTTEGSNLRMEKCLTQFTVYMLAESPNVAAAGAWGSGHNLGQDLKDPRIGYLLRFLSLLGSSWLQFSAMVIIDSQN